MPSKDKRRALEVFHMMVLGGLCASIGHKEVGRFTKKLKPEDREALKHLKSEDLQHWIK